MKTKNILILFLLLGGLVADCSRVPLTGRVQVNLLPENILIDMSLTHYREFLQENKVVSGHPNTEMVKRVGNRIAKAAEEYLKSPKHRKRIKNFKWEFNLVEDKTANAWCMPGGKVVVYTGLLPYTQTEAGLAVVMGHEIAHAIARHGNERMSQLLMAQMGGVALSVALADKPDETHNLFMTAYGVGATLGILLPYSRTHESEADKMGLIFMAMAGYNPNEAVAFWQRMSTSSSAHLPEIFSTHPSNETRIKQIKEFMPTAMRAYRPQ